MLKGTQDPSPQVNSGHLSVAFPPPGGRTPSPEDQTGNGDQTRLGVSRRGRRPAGLTTDRLVFAAWTVGDAVAHLRHVDTGAVVAGEASHTRGDLRGPWRTDRPALGRVHKPAGSHVPYHSCPRSHRKRPGTEACRHTGPGGPRTGVHSCRTPVQVHRDTAARRWRPDSLSLRHRARPEGHTGPQRHSGTRGSYTLDTRRLVQTTEGYRLKDSVQRRCPTQVSNAGHLIERT